MRFAHAMIGAARLSNEAESRRDVPITVPNIAQPSKFGPNTTSNRIPSPFASVIRPYRTAKFKGRKHIQAIDTVIAIPKLHRLSKSENMFGSFVRVRKA
jgi:hypothetical protein